MLTNNGVTSQLSETHVAIEATISERLVEARKAAISLPAFPGQLPSDTKTAYAIQHQSINSWPDEVSGWKVGGISTLFLEQFAARRLAGPIFKSQTLTVPDSEAVTASVFENGFAAVEAEFVIRTAVPLRPSEPVKTHEELKNCIASIHVGVEIASSPMADINELGPGAIISDFGNNAGLIVGPQIMNWRERAANDIDISVVINGVEAGAIRTRISEDAFAAFEFLSDLSHARGIELPAGTLVTCGALSGIHDVEIGDQASVVFSGLGKLDVRVAKRPPSE
jgi:2-keto-4-pentenoate hydratase